MKTLMVDYDLMSPGQKYAAVEKYLKAQSDWAKVLQSTWMIRTTKSAAQVRDEVWRIIDSNDKVVVTDVTHSEMAWNGPIPDDVTNWIKRNVSPRAYVG